MTPGSTLALFKLVLIAGLALWMTLALINNVVAFRAGTAAIARLMSMQLLRQSPAIDTPLLSRAVENSRLHAYLAATCTEAARFG